MNPEIATNALWEAINALDAHIVNGYDVIRVRNARAALQYIENWCLPSHNE